MVGCFVLLGGAATLEIGCGGSKVAAKWDAGDAGDARDTSPPADVPISSDGTTIFDAGVDADSGGTSRRSRPNIVIIYADDMGFGDIGAYGARFGTTSPAPTPHMDALATDGLMFTQAHSSNGVCTPSRYALLTGKYNWRTFSDVSWSYAAPDIPSSDTTLAEFLKTQGYHTAAFGKWHLGGYLL